MNRPLTNGNDLLILAFIIQLTALVFVPIIKNERRSIIVFTIILLCGLVLGLISTLFSMLFTSVILPDYIIRTVIGNWIRLDGLSLYFLFIIQLIAIPTALYNYSYLQHYLNNKMPIKSFVIFYLIVMVSTQIVVIANHAILFLISWEVMSISAYLAMLFEKEKKEVQQGSFYFLVATHTSVFILYIFFFLLHHESNSWFFSDYHISFTGNLAAVLFILSFIGFGIKAGFMPFHFWLPQAHPIAPTVLSAFLSGVIIKTGIYGILRTFLFLKPVPGWCGWIVLIVGMVSAIFGVWYALAQHDIKKLLAYHSVENIGIIGIGIGIGFIGSAANMPVIEILGFGGALLHTLNHAIFKSLLFIGSGVIYQNLGTRNIELMGGLVHKAKYLTILFLIGSVAICGLPPFNGFISEFIIYNSFFQTAKELKNYYPLSMLLFVVGLAFVGGLAVACFAKINSIMFLGSERKPVANYHTSQFHTTVFDFIPLIIFASLCVIIGFYPQPFIGIVNKVLTDGFVPNNSTSALINMNWSYLTLIFIFILFGVIILYYAVRKIQRKYGRRTSAAWGCGYEGLTPRMQYTASSFADELNSIVKVLLIYKKKVKISKDVFPKPVSFESHSLDLIDDKIVIPGFNFLKSMIMKIEFLSQTDIRYYILFILIIITIYSFIAFIWV
jgi:formate hydrogenlyase subunit 3/multisubunit Na+/H+ antiporter MnhD subunit